jgi:glycyl-tRNA synthetase
LLCYDPIPDCIPKFAAFMASTAEDSFKQVISHSKEYGFIFQSSEIYDGLSAVYDYGQNGAQLKKNIRDYWWAAMTQLNQNIAGIDSAIFMHPRVWKASGHVDAFNDPLIDNLDSKKRYRADVLIEDQVVKLEEKIAKEVEKAASRFENFDEKMFRSTNKRVLDYQEKIDTVNRRFKKALEDNDLKEIRQIIVDLEISCPVSGTRNWTEVRQFNLMFSTAMGSLAEDSSEIYLRPETAQGIFVNFLNVQKSGRMKIPFGIAQTGKAFRNEIVARQFIFRMREFEQMEMQYFVRPGTEMEWYEHWKTVRLNWHLSLGLGREKYRFHDHLKTAHYANAACDIEFEFPFGFKELEGIHSRTDYDLKQHETFSGKNLRYFDPEINQSYIPYVVETSVGLDRMFLAVLSSSLKEEKLENDTRSVLALPAALAPCQVAIFPLVKKDGLPEIAEKLTGELKFSLRTAYDEKDTVGKRYRRHDAIGTPYCVTVDHQTLEDETVTLRHRDSMRQERIRTDRVAEIVREKAGMDVLLRSL